MIASISGINAKVRKLLDVKESSFADSEIDRYIVEAFARLNALCPASRYIDGKIGTVAFPSDDALLHAFTFEVEDKWEIGLAYYATARCYEAGITDAVNLQLAQTLKQQADAVFAL